MATLIGQTLLSQFRVDAFVAAGGMGSVYRVWDLKRNVPLAMKVLHSELAEDPSMFKKFQREARALQKLGHPNIVPFYGIYESMEVVFMLERFVDGPSMKDMLKRHKAAPVPMEEALIYLKALCAALGYAHANGVVHCDIKPGNVMIDSSGQIYLTDFGIARHAESATTTIDSAGTAAYMPPEQIRGEPVTPSTDVYALGIILYEMLVGRRPFRGSGVETASADKSTPTISMKIRQEQLHMEAQSPQELNPEISDELAQVTLKALNKKAAQRYEDAAQFFAAVCAAANMQPESIPDRVVLPDVFQKEEKSATADMPQQTGTPLPARIKGAALVIIGSMALAVMLGAFFWNGRAETTPAAYSSYTTTPPNPMQVSAYSATFTSAPNHDLQTAVVILTQAASLPTSTPTIHSTATPSTPPTAAAPYCDTLELTPQYRTKGIYLTVCLQSVSYEMGPLADGKFVSGPNQVFFVYVTTNGEVYAARVAKDQTFFLVGKIKTFTSIKKKEDPNFSISFQGDHPYQLLIEELTYNEIAAFNIPSVITLPK